MVLDHVPVNGNFLTQKWYFSQIFVFLAFLRRGAFSKRLCPSVFCFLLFSVCHTFLYGKTLPLFLSDIIFAVRDKVSDFSRHVSGRDIFSQLSNFSTLNFFNINFFWVDQPSLMICDLQWSMISPSLTWLCELVFLRFLHYFLFILHMMIDMYEYDIQVIKKVGNYNP